ncbi:MAG: DUF1648 domain-containing protein [Halobacteriaceae archaeon]
MNRLPSRTDAVGLAAAGVALLAGVAVWPRLPEQMVIHVSVTGSPDGSIARPLGIAVLPVCLVVTLGINRWATRVDPPADDGTASAVSLATTGLFVGLQAVVLAWNLDYQLPAGLLLPAVLSWGAVLVAYVLARERR